MSENGAKDEVFNIQVPSAKLIRTVEMYQWDEDCETDSNDHRQCTYKQVWSDELIDSEFFEDSNHINPTTMPYTSETFFNQDAKMGAYKLNNKLLNQLSTTESVDTLDIVKVQELGLEISENKYYTNVKNNEPQIGDIRISFNFNNSKNVSVLAIQSKDGFQEFVSSSGYKINKLQEGTHSGKSMLQDLTNENNTLKWIFRLIGTLLVIISFAAIISPLQRLANNIPIIGTLFGWASGIFIFVLGTAVSLFVIAIAWLRYRPVFSIVLLLCIISILIIVIKLKNKKTKQEQTPTNVNNLQNAETIPNQSAMNPQYQQNINTESGLSTNNPTNPQNSDIK